MSADVSTMVESPTSAGVSVMIYSHVGWGINYISNHYTLAELSTSLARSPRGVQPRLGTRRHVDLYWVKNVN